MNLFDTIKDALTGQDDQAAQIAEQSAADTPASEDQGSPNASDGSADDRTGGTSAAD